MKKPNRIILHRGDLDPHLQFGPIVAVDTEAQGLLTTRDKLCLVQLHDPLTRDVHLIQYSHDFYKQKGQSPHLKSILENPERLVIFHYARFDVAALFYYLNIRIPKIFCTKIASKLTRTYTQHHGLNALSQEFLGFSLPKQEQTSHWFVEDLTQSQKDYAAMDVFVLPTIYAKLVVMLEQNERTHLAEASFNYIQTRAELDILGWLRHDIFSHESPTLT